MARRNQRAQKRGKSDAQKYAPVPVNSRPAPTSEVSLHLRAFVSAFINADAQGRWDHCLFAVPQRAQQQLQRFHLNLDPAYCRELQGGEGFPLRLAEVYGNQVGVYFDCESNALIVTAAEAATLVVEYGVDALLSLVPGKRALCFDHDGGIWACER